MINFVLKSNRLRCADWKALCRISIIGASVWFAPAAQAQDATWSGVLLGNSDWSTATNWTPNGVPTGVAIFDGTASGFITDVNGAVSIGELRFENSPFQVVQVAAGSSLTITGAGVTGTSFVSALSNLGVINFQNNAGAGSITINNRVDGALGIFGTVNFNGNSSAGQSYIINDFDRDTETAGVVNFNGTSTASSALIANYGIVNFNETSTAGDANIYNNRTLTFQGNNASTFVTAGNASIVNNSTGTISFLTNSTAGNATIENDGTLVFRNNSNAGTARITNTNMLEFYGTSSAANATITNTSSLYFYDTASAGNAQITNSYELVFYGNSTAGNATIFNTGGTYFVSNSTAGDARLVALSGVFDFTGTFGPNGDYRVSAGSIEGAGTFAIGGVTLTVGSNNLSTEVTGTIIDFCCNGAGNLIKTGTGTLTLSGTNTYTGFTWVEQGTLVINGSITSNTTVYANAILGGNGTIFGDLTINSGGILSPGNSIGTMTIDGNVTFTNATYRVEVEPGRSDRVNASGTVTISGGTVEVQGVNANYGARQRTVIINGTGGVSGTFSSVTDNLAFYDSALEYDTNNVYLVLSRNANAFLDFASTPNQRAVAAGLARGDSNAAIIAAVLALSEQNVRIAFDSLSGELYASLSGAFIDESRYLRDAILSRLRAAAFQYSAGALGYLGEGSQLLGYAPRARRDAPFGRLRGRSEPEYEFWAQAFGAWARSNSDNNAAAAKRATGGFIVGADRQQGDARLGLTAGYSNTQLRIDNRGSKADADTFHFAGYFAKAAGNWSLRSGAALSLHNVNSERTIAVPVADTLKADYFSYTGQVFAEIARAHVWREFAFEPFANAAFVHNRIGSFVEQGGIAALASNGADNAAGFASLGLRIATNHQLQNGWVLAPRSTVAWQHAIGRLAPEARLTLQNASADFTIHGVPLTRDALVTETGFDLRVRPNLTLGTYYTGRFASDLQDHAVRGRVDFRF